MKKMKKLNLGKLKIAKLQKINKVIGGTKGGVPTNKSKNAGPMCVPDLTQLGVNC